MTSSQQYESYLPQSHTIPEDWENGRAYFVEHFKKIVNNLNVKEIGYYLDEEVLTGKQFIPSSTTNYDTSTPFRNVFRMVVNFGQLPNNTTKSVAHNITVNSNFTLVSIYGGATNPSNFNCLPLPFVSAGASGQIELYMDATNINITTTSDRTAWTTCFIVCEYLLEP